MSDPSMIINPFFRRTPESSFFASLDERNLNAGFRWHDENAASAIIIALLDLDVQEN